MEKEVKRDLWIGGSIAVAIFIGILIVVMGIDYAQTQLTDPKPTAEIGAEENIETTEAEPDTITPAITEPPNISSAKSVLYFPLVVSSQSSQTKITFQNNTETQVNDLVPTLMGKVGEWHTYRPMEIPPQEKYILQTSKLANLPELMTPGVATVTSDEAIAGIAEISNSNGLTSRPIKPYVDLQQDLYFNLTRNSEQQAEQNVLVVTNLSSTLIEVQLAFSKAGETSSISDPLEVQPWNVKIIDLTGLLGSETLLSQFESIMVSASAPSMIAAAAQVDQTLTTWQKVITGEPK